MAYGANLLLNNSAETQDTTLWVISPLGSVTALEKTTPSASLLSNVDGYETPLPTPFKIMVDGGMGEYAFSFSPLSDITMYQILLASDIGAQPVSFQFNARFKLQIEQELYDNSVNGFVQLEIIYSNSTRDYYIIPFVKGITHINRYLFNNWLISENVCLVDSVKILSSVKVTIRSINCPSNLLVDYIELRKEL
jgi:hypothetical protein